MSTENCIVFGHLPFRGLTIELKRLLQIPDLRPGITDSKIQNCYMYFCLVYFKFTRRISLIKLHTEINSSPCGVNSVATY